MENQTPVAGAPAVLPPKPKPKLNLKLAGLTLLGILALVGIVLGAITLLRGGRLGGTANLVWWGLWEDETSVLPLISEFEKQNPGIKIKYIRQSQEDYRERLTNVLAAGTGPDIFRFHNSWIPMFKKDLDFLPSSVMTAGEFAQTFYPIASSDLVSGTGILGIPLEYDGLMLYINDEIFAANAKTAPATWDDLRSTALALTQKDDQGTITQAGIALGRTENVDHWQEILALMLLQNGVNLEKPTGKLAEDALLFYTIFSSTDQVWDETLPPSTTAFAAGKLAMYIGPSWRTFEIKQQNPTLKFSTHPLPQLPKENSSQAGVAYGSYWVEGVWKKSKNKEAAWKFLAFLSTKESLEKLYQNAATQRLFGEPYPRPDMADLLSSDLILGALISQAKDAQSWYLQSRTFDGPTGVNSLIGKYFEDAVNAVNAGTSATQALETASQGVSQVLSQYGATR